MMLQLLHLFVLLAFSSAASESSSGTCVVGQPGCAAANADAAVAAAVATAAGTVEEVLEDSRYIVKMGGKLVGRMSMTVKRQGARVQSIEALEVVMQRGEDRTAMIVETEVVEDAEGGMIMQRLAHQLGALGTTTVRWVWPEPGSGGMVAETSTTGRGAPIQRQLPAPQNAKMVGRYTSERQFREQAKAGATEIELVTVRPEFGLQAVTLRRTLLQTTELPAGCGNAPPRAAAVWKNEIDGVPTNMSESYSLDAAAVLLRSEMESPFGWLDCTLCSGDDAESQLEAAAADKVLVGGGPLPEIVYGVAVRLARPERGLSWPGAKSATFEVRHVGGLVLSLPTAGCQTVLDVNGDSRVMKVHVDITSAPQRATAAELADQEYVDATAMVNSDDEMISALSAKLLAGISPTDRMQQAHVLRLGVRRHILKSTLRTGFATASETVRSQEGDCTEHGMLLAALLRAAKIPSRVCTGLVYTEQTTPLPTPGVTASLVWHMWTQALIDGRWVDLDATLDVPFHGGHILTSTSSMVNILTLRSSEMEMLRMIGSLEVTVLDATHLQV